MISFRSTLRSTEGGIGIGGTFGMGDDMSYDYDDDRSFFSRSTAGHASMHGSSMHGRTPLPLSLGGGSSAFPPSTSKSLSLSLSYNTNNNVSIQILVRLLIVQCTLCSSCFQYHIQVPFLCSHHHYLCTLVCPSQSLLSMDLLVEVT